MAREGEAAPGAVAPDGASMLVRQRSALPSEVTIQPLTLELVDGLRIVHNEGFGSKYCCLCCPVADTEGKIAQFYAKHPERLAACGLAVDKAGTPLGYVQLAIHPMSDKDGMHTTKPGETGLSRQLTKKYNLSAIIPPEVMAGEKYDFKVDVRAQKPFSIWAWSLG